jgi:TetR/AcrR family transcriptional regulator, regulator of cefoperazone and chloramphenicol sensitivity
MRADLHRAAEDLTARARIRDAALRMFAERGIAGATIRDIATAAGVSSGLIRHHFGSKDELRRACDTYVLEHSQAIREYLLVGGGLADPAFLGSIQETATLMQTYLMRSMMDGSAAAAEMFEVMVRQTEQAVAAANVERVDPRGYAVTLVAMIGGVFLMQDQISRSLGVDVRSGRGYFRLSGAMLDVLTEPLLTPEQAAQLRAAMQRAQAQASD